MGFLVDTSIWVDVERGKLAAADIHAITGTAPVFLSPVNVAELGLGAELLRDPGQRQKAFASLRRLRRKPILRMDFHTGEVFGSLAAALRKSGRGESFRVMDVWLAAQAIQHGHKVLTSNVQDFRGIPGIDLVELPRQEKGRR